MPFHLDSPRDVTLMAPSLERAMDWGRNRTLRVGKLRSILSRLWTKVHDIFDDVGENF